MNGSGANPASIPVIDVSRAWSCPGRLPRTGDQTSWSHAMIFPCASKPGALVHHERESVILPQAISSLRVSCTRTGLPTACESSAAS